MSWRCASTLITSLCTCSTLIYCFNCCLFCLDANHSWKLLRVAVLVGANFAWEMAFYIVHVFCNHIRVLYGLGFLEQNVCKQWFLKHCRRYWMSSLCYSSRNTEYWCSGNSSGRRLETGKVLSKNHTGLCRILSVPMNKALQSQQFMSQPSVVLQKVILVL